MVEHFKWQTTAKHLSATQECHAPFVLSSHHGGSGTPGALDKIKHDQKKTKKEKYDSFGSFHLAFYGSNLAYYIKLKKAT